MSQVLIVDCQVLQTTAFHRGMGRYTLSLLRALLQNDQARKSSYLLLNSNLPISDELQTVLNSLTSAEHVMSVSLVVPRNADVRYERLQNKQRLETFIAKNFMHQEVSYLITSLFTFDYSAVFPGSVRKLLLFYDLIPYIKWEAYQRFFPSHLYFEHFNSIFEADHIFTISQTTANDLTEYLGLNPRGITSINGGPFYPEHTSKPLSRLEQLGSFILMPSGDMEHKNNVRAVTAFQSVNQQLGGVFKLVITSSISPENQHKLSLLCDDIVFTGNVSDEELTWLYENTDLVFFPSEIEGLGMPPLEAALHNKPVACSDIPVLKEMTKSGFYFFNPTDVSDMECAIEDAIMGKDWETKKRSYQKLLKEYTWDSAAQKLHALVEPAEKKRSHKKLSSLAIIMPHPSSGHPIGRLFQQLHPLLKEHFKVSYYLDGGGQPSGPHPTYLDRVADSHDAAHFTAVHYQKYDYVLFVLDDSLYAVEATKRALVFPGYILLASDSLESVYAAMLERRLITQDDLEYERSLNADFLTSVLADRPAFITYGSAKSQTHALGHHSDIKSPASQQNLESFCAKLQELIEKGSLNRKKANLIKQSPSGRKLLLKLSQYGR